MLITGSEYHCVDKITEELKIPLFFVVFPSRTGFQFKLYFLGPAIPITLFLHCVSFLPKLPSIHAVCLGHFSTQEFKPDPIPKRTARPRKKKI